MMRRFYVMMMLCMCACAGNLPGGAHPSESAAINLETFARTVWAPTLSQQCYGCHLQGGIAQADGSQFVLTPLNSPQALATNYETTRSYVSATGTRLMDKATGNLKHYGGTVLAAEDAGTVALQAFVQNIAGAAPADAPPTVNAWADKLVPMNTAVMLRKAALALAARVPTDVELQQAAQSVQGMDAVLDALLREPAFLDRVVETYNTLLDTDVYLTDNAAITLTTAFYPNAAWYQTPVNPNIANPNAAQAYAAQMTNRSLAREPLNVIAYVVHNDLPFTQVLTGDTTVVNPFSACAYGVQKNVPFAQPVTCDTGAASTYNYYDLHPVDLGGPHAGLLSNRFFLTKHSNTVTNRNRHRANTVTSVFLGMDILTLSGARVNVMQQSAPLPWVSVPQCVVCHRTMDPIAGTFQNRDGIGVVTASPWYADMAPPGYGTLAMPAADQNNALLWLAQQVIADPRFVRQTVATAYTLVTGMQILDVPAASDPQWHADFVAYRLQQTSIDAWADTFRRNNYSFKTLVKAIVTSPWFATQQPAAALNDSDAAVAESFTHRRLVTPGAMDARITALLGVPWADPNGVDYLTGTLYTPYGGIDSVLELNNPDLASASISAINLRMATELACRMVPRAFSAATDATSVAVRTRLFSDASAARAGADADVRANIVHMLWLLVGEQSQAGDADVNDLVALYNDVLKQAQSGAAPALPSACAFDSVTSDPTGAVQAWMAVVAVMLSDCSWMYE